MGISKESFTKAYSEYNTKYKKVFDKYYGEGGEFEIPKEDLKATYTANNYSYGYHQTISVYGYRSDTKQIVIHISLFSYILDSPTNISHSFILYLLNNY